MHGTELHSFIFKFHQLWKAGVTAHLDLDTHAGQAWVGLRVHLGQGHQHGAQPKPRRNPAYYRRQERRKAAKAAASTPISVTTPAEKAVGTFEVAVNTAETVTEPAEKNLEEHIENAEKAISDTNSRNAEKAPSCDFCEKTFGSVQDLKRHEEKKHNNCSGSPIPQMDGEDDSYLNYSFKSELPPIIPGSCSSSTRPPCTPTRGSHPSTSTSPSMMPTHSPPSTSPSPLERNLACAPPSPRTPCAPSYTTIEEMKAAIREAFKK